MFLWIPLQAKRDVNNSKINSRDSLFWRQLLHRRAASLSCICWDAQHRAGLCLLPERRKHVLLTERNYRDDENWTERLLSCFLCTLSLRLILAPQDSRNSTMVLWPVLVATCRGVLFSCSVTTTQWLLFVCKSTRKHTTCISVNVHALASVCPSAIKMPVHLISHVQVSTVTLQDLNNFQASPSAGPVYGPRAQLKHSSRDPSC